MTQLSSPAAHPGANATPADLDAQIPAWYLAYTKPQQEAVAADQLARQGYGVYLPLYKTWPKAGGKRAAAGSAGAAPSAVFEPMFPRYVFFRPSCASQSLSPARSTRGVSTLVSFGLGPAPVNPLLIDTIRSLEARRNQADAQALTPFQPGAAVLLNADPFRGLQALVVPSAWANEALALHQLAQLPGEPEAAHSEAMWQAFDRAMAYGQRERAVQQGLAAVAFARWPALEAGRRQGVLAMVAQATLSQQRALLALARRHQIELALVPG